MRIASNSHSDIARFFSEELRDIYTEDEIQRLLQWMLEKVLNVTATYLATHVNLRINESDLLKIEQMCYELKRHKPIQYILGEAEFFGLTLKVNEHVLIPRPETEELVEQVVWDIRSLEKKNCRILDLGTGSGCIAIAIKKQVPFADVYAVDISDEALELARCNATNNHAQVTFAKADILSANISDKIKAFSGNQPFDVLVSNPPYILPWEKDFLHVRVKNFEPSSALFVEGNDPLLFYRCIAAIGTELLQPGGAIWFECHALYAISVQQMLAATSIYTASLHKDLSGNDRFVSARKLA